jgi:hypothetical protein
MTKKKRRMTDEYMDELWAKIEARMKHFEETASHQDKMILDCMVRDWEAKMKLKIQNEKEKETFPGEISPW